ncbi:MAG: hypothetical protein SF069_02625 [Phycisphaerae bacterium]|nr:hypothetical protein [Phycisphaerae bacterium]
MNNTGSVIATAPPDSRTFLFAYGVPLEINRVFGLESSVLFDINDANDLVGRAVFPPSRPIHFDFSTGELTPLPVLSAWGGTAYALNNHGVIVGACFTWTNGERAVRWVNGALEDVSPPTVPMGNGNVIRAIDINDANQLLGVYLWSEAGQGRASGFVIDEEAYIFLPPELFPVAINNAGQVLCRDQNGSGALVWDDGVVTPIVVDSGGLVQVYEAIDDFGRIYGNWGPFGQIPVIVDSGNAVDLRSCFPANACPGQLAAVSPNGVMVGSYKRNCTSGDFDCYILVPEADLNWDGVVTVGDIGPFVLALTEPLAYRAEFGWQNPPTGDMNGDGNVTVGDIGEFVRALTE